MGYFKLERGARQGDPISAYLFILVIEVFFQMIRKNSGIKGLDICGHLFNIIAYADDATILCRDLDSIKQLKATFDKFSKYSGLLLNSSKTEICGIGVKRGVDVALCGMKSVNLLTDSVKILGIYFSYNEEIMRGKNFMRVITKIERVLAVWRMRILTLAGKITVLKSLIFSKIVFIAFLSTVPETIVKCLIKLKNEFVWDNKPPKIKHTAMIGSYERGGLKDIDIESRIKALRLSWVKRLYDDSDHEWKIIPNFYLEKYAKNIFNPNLKIKVNNNLPKFYKSVILLWEKVSVCDPITMENVLVQPIRYNGRILVNRNVITWKDAVDLYIQNFYNENGDILTWEEFKVKNMKGDNFHFKWRQIVDAIPREWKGKIASERLYGSPCSVVPEPHLQVISRRLPLSRLVGKEFYTILVNKIWEKPTSEAKIEELLDITDLNWKKIYMLGRKITLDSYSRQFYFKLTHNVLFLNKALHRMRLVESSMCSFCETTEETVVHLFSECQYVLGLWSRIQFFFVTKLSLPDLSPQSAILGFQQLEDSQILKNLILLIFKMVLYKDRESKSCSFERFLNKVKMIMKIEHALCTNQDYNDLKWNPIRGLF